MTLQMFQGRSVGILGAGYVGRHFSDFLRRRLQEAGIQAEIELYDRGRSPEIFGREFDFFLHAAGTTGNFRQEPLPTIDSGVTLTSRLLKELKVRRSLVLLSSTRLYGFHPAPPQPADEAQRPVVDHLSQDFIYDGSKLLMECLAAQAPALVPYRVRVARLSNLYGRFPAPLDQSTLLKKMIQAAAERRPLTVSDSGQSSKDYVHIDDALTGLIQMMSYDGPEWLFNIASGESTSLAEVARILGLQAAFNDALQARHCPVSIGKARGLLGFSPRTSFARWLPTALSER